MARPSDSNSEETHRRIIEAAQGLLDTVPARELSLRKVAKLAELSVGTVGYYFGTRDELLEAVLEDHYERMVELKCRPSCTR